jgi:hypothetical protein
MVAVVQLVERQVVILEVAGSSPVSHPRKVGGHFAVRPFCIPGHFDQVDELGLDYAHRVVGSGAGVIGVGVAKTQTNLTADIVKLEAELAGVLGLDPGTVAPTVLPGYLGAGYAIPTDGGQAALHLLAESEAILSEQR